MCPQRCLFFLKWRQNQSSWKIKSNPSFTAECYATAFKMHKSVYSRSFATDAWHVHWRRENLEYFYLLSFICGKNPPVCDCDGRDVSSVDDRYKMSWRLETVVSREKCLISLPSARARRAWSCHFHLFHYFLFSSTPARSGPIKCRIVLQSVACHCQLQYVGATPDACPWIMDHLSFLMNT